MPVRRNVWSLRAFGLAVQCAPPLCKRLVRHLRFTFVSVKTGAGFYRYEGKAQMPNESLAQRRRALHGEPEGAEGPNIPADRHRDPRPRLSEEDLRHRLILLIVNEAAR